MPNDFRVGEHVYLPRSVLGITMSSASAMYRTKVQDVKAHGIVVTLPDGNASQPVPWILAHRQSGVLLVQFGDFQSEHNLFDPLRLSLENYLRLLLGDDEIRTFCIRTEDELTRLWVDLHAVISHVVMIGHGIPGFVKLGLSGYRSAVEFAMGRDIPTAQPVHFVSLCCHSGLPQFGEPFSRWRLCQTFIGPTGSLHGASASQFTQTYFARRFLLGESVTTAWHHARRATPGATELELWHLGHKSLRFTRAGDKINAQHRAGQRGGKPSSDHRDDEGRTRRA